MLNLTAKSLQHVQTFVAKLEKRAFDESDVAALLLAIRNHFPNHDLLWELAAFYAHQEQRDKGISHKLIDVNYAKLLYVHANDGSRVLPHRIVPRNVFRTVFMHAVELFDDDLLRQKCQMGRSDLQRLVRKNYTHQNGNYLLSGRDRLPSMLAGVEAVMRNAEFLPPIPQKGVIDQFVDVFLAISKQHPFAFDVECMIRSFEDDIIVCLLCLIHSARVKLFDGTYGECFLTTIQRPDSATPGGFIWVLAVNYQFTISKATFSSSILETIGEASSYLKGTDLGAIQSGKPLPRFKAVRDANGELVLG